MTIINSLNSFKQNYQSTTNNSNRKYCPNTTQPKTDTVELSAKETTPSKKGFKKYILAGLAILGGGLAIVLGVKHMNAEKLKQLEEKAKQEAERLRQKAEEEARKAQEEGVNVNGRKQPVNEPKGSPKAEELEEIHQTKPETVEPAKPVEEKPVTEPKEEIKTETPVQEDVISEPQKPELKEEPVKEPEPVKEDIKTNEPEIKEPVNEAKPEIKTEVKPEIKEEIKTEPKQELKEEPKIKPPKTRPVRPQGLSQAMNTALDFGEDLTDLVKNKNATPEEIQKLVQKHFNNDNIRIHGMSEYDGMGINAKGKAATTRPFFNEEGKLETIDIFVPDLDYNDANAVMEFISKTTHEMTHVSQFIAKDGSNAEYLKPTMEGRCLNYIQKIITDRYTEKLPMDVIKALFKEDGFIPKSAEDVNKFFDRPNSDLSLERIGEITQLGRDEMSQKRNINIIFDVLFDPMMEQMAPRDPNVQSLISKHGGYEGFKSEMKRICAETFKNEQEAYRAEEIMRQELSGNAGKDTNYGVIHKIMGICAEALG